MDEFAKRKSTMDGYSIESLDITGYDAPVPNSYWTRGSNTLVILLPGLGYTNDMPIMFYLHQLAIDRGYDVLQVNYDYRGIPRDTSASDWADRMLSDVRPAIDGAIARGTYSNVIVAGKSIGTRVMTTLLARGFDKATALMWITPLLVVEQIRDTLKSHGPSVAVFGDADYAVQGVELAPIVQTGTTMIVMPGGDHGMMIPGSVPESIAALAHVINELDAWLGQHVTASGDPV